MAHSKMGKVCEKIRVGRRASSRKQLISFCFKLSLEHVLMWNRLLVEFTGAALPGAPFCSLQRKNQRQRKSAEYTVLSNEMPRVGRAPTNPMFLPDAPA